MKLLEARAFQGNIATPLICYYPITHYATHDRQYIGIEEELGRITIRIPRHGQEVSLWTTVRSICIGFYVPLQRWQKCFAAGINKTAAQTRSQDTKAQIVELGNHSHQVHRLGTLCDGLLLGKNRREWQIKVLSVMAIYQ